MFDPERRCTRVEAWPAPDQAAWKLALAPYDPLEPTVGYASRWAPATRAIVENGYGRWLGWLERSGDLDPDSTPGARATRERVNAYRKMLVDLEYAPYTVAGRLQQLGDALRSLEPGSDFGWILRAAGRLHEQAHPVKDLNDRLRPAEEVLQLGLDLMDAAEQDRFRTDYDRAVMFRDGLALAALIHRPLRIKNFASIRIGEQLRRDGDHWRLTFTPGEMKSRRPFECVWPDELTAALDRYIEVHRAVLLDDAKDRVETDALWVAKGGAGMTTLVLAYRITKRTGDEFGTAINPHTFRHIAATTIATDDPENITGVPSVLGHATLETSEKHYNMAKMIDAGARYQATLKAARKNGGRLVSSAQQELAFGDR